MRPENTEPNRREKRSAALGLGLFALLQIACAVGFWALGQVPEMPRWLTILWWVLAGMCLVLLLPAAWALHIRIQEVDRGDAADMTKEESVMLLLNIEYVPGKEIEALGMVKGTVVQSKNFGKDFMAGMKTLVGGEITGYTEMLIEARQIAVKRMVDEAEALGGGCHHQRPLRLGLGDAGGRRGHRLRHGGAVSMTGVSAAVWSAGKGFR